ncbi:MAG TPA: hypothetical protein DCE49_02645, partial [Pseudomonas sp.]|nr:hypothetical protein [Pseudomonas sp.]
VTGECETPDLGKLKCRRAAVAALRLRNKRGESLACLYQGPQNWLPGLLQRACQFRQLWQRSQPVIHRTSPEVLLRALGCSGYAGFSWVCRG